jgi:hypothetical protein
MFGSRIAGVHAWSMDGFGSLGVLVFRTPKYQNTQTARRSQF